MGIGAKIGEVAKEKGISLKELSRKINIPYTTLYHAVKRDSKIEYEIAVKVASALGVSVDEFYTIGDVYTHGYKDSIEAEAYELNSLITNLGYAVLGANIDGKYKMWLESRVNSSDEKYKYYQFDYTELRKIFDEINDCAMYCLSTFEDSHSEIDILKDKDFLECNVAGRELLFAEVNQRPADTAQSAPVSTPDKDPAKK